MPSALAHVWRATREPHRARGQAPVRQRIMLAIMAHGISRGWRWMTYTLPVLMRVLRVRRRKEADNG